ncbi:polysaccharide biosynthesis/export family protein [Rhodobacteraceae bacterium N5(2021)]|uniref:Polysaccharide biosynthesis/export family protein n=1 Tax=Gymnodinialimonas phycosphaerae TaxID=2841589 RepID=A0A975TVA1_9RHOB|nr:polysaccharide biosynthesis/export family protein [Gymnodinialimonas phycosphaerae]MBY4894727.1 polysaccharide biosynthesis/export family protein [Gymnodinialimonas phycosphaerae]
MVTLQTLLACMCVIVLGACGSAYVSPDVSGFGGDDGVQVVDLSPAVVTHANRSAYQPQDLPAAFSRIAGGTTGPRGAARLPDPVFDAQARPGAVELRVPPAVNPGSYRIGVGDVLLLATPRGESTVEELAGLVAAQNQRQGYTVQDDGDIAIPDVGRITVGDMTLAEAEDAIFERLIAARIDPSFSLEVAEFNSQRISVGGAVRNPGVVPVGMTPVYLAEVLASAGGLDITSDDFAVIRIYRDGNLYQIPTSDLYSDQGLQRIRLVDGDSLFVDTAYDFDQAQAYFEEVIARAEYTQSARANAIAELQTEVSIRRGALEESRQNFRDRVEFGAEGGEFVYIAGEVTTPGRFELPFENRAVLADALFDAGGWSASTGNPSQIYLMRAQENSSYASTVTAYRLDGSNAANLVLATRLELRPGDVVFVAEQPVTRWSRVINQITPTVINLGAAAVN